MPTNAALAPSHSDDAPNWGQIQNEKGEIVSAKKYHQEREENRKIYIKEKKQRNKILTILLWSVIILFPIAIIKYSNNVKLGALRVLAWYPLLIMPWVVIHPIIYFIALAFIPVYIILWFQYSLPTKEVIISFCLFGFVMVPVSFFIYVMSSLASQGVGK